MLPPRSTPGCSASQKSPGLRPCRPYSCAPQTQRTTTTSVSSGSARTPQQEHQRTIGLYHLAWQVDTIDQLASLRTALIDSGGYTGESSHGATKSVYGADPDGNEFELMWMVPRAEWGRYGEAAVVDRLDFAAEIERWSGVGTADELGAIGAEGHVTGPIPLS